MVQIGDSKEETNLEFSTGFGDRMNSGFCGNKLSFGDSENHGVLFISIYVYVS